MSGAALYRVRESGRAKHVRLTITPRDGLVVIVPRRFDHSRIPALVEERSEWVQSAARRLGVPLEELAARHLPPQPPTEIDLPALGEHFAVSYDDGPDPVRRVSTTGRTLVLRGRREDEAALLEALRRWLSVKARAGLAPQVRALAEARDLTVTSVAIRGQRTRWASCSPRGVISLNRALLFLRPDLVRYVLLHELCHLREPNHSSRFWRLLADEEPRSYELKHELGRAWRAVPRWSE